MIFLKKELISLIFLRKGICINTIFVFISHFETYLKELTYNRLQNDVPALLDTFAAIPCNSKAIFNSLQSNAVYIQPIPSFPVHSMLTLSFIIGF